MLAASLGSLAVLWGLSWSGAEDAVATVLSDHLAAEAALVGEHLREVPVDVLVGLGAGHASAAVGGELERLTAASGLHDAALLGPDGVVLGSGGTWLPAAADADLVERARAGARVAGPLYRADDGELYLAAYAPLPDRAGWVVAVEGSATLGAVDRLARRQAVASAVVLAVVAVLAGVLARRVAAPLRALEQALERVRPGDPPDAVAAAGPREVWRVAQAAQGLLAAIRERDGVVEAAHRAQVAQVTRLAAEIAHEIRNPLNAVGLSIERLGRLDDAGRRAELAARLQGQVDDLEAIVGRLVDLTRPLKPRVEPVDLAGVVADLADEAGVRVACEGAASATTDRAMVREILRNLVLNAEQAGASAVTVRLRTGDRVAVEVEDDGPGVAAPEHLFAWFHTTRAKGTGLGLATSRRMAEALRGTLVLASARPAVFHLELPGGP